jgi:hypothetical protein
MSTVLWSLLIAAGSASAATALVRGRQRLGLAVYRVERADGSPVGVDALAAAILGAGFGLVEQRRRFLVSRTHGRDRVIVPLPWSRVLGAGAIELRASDRDLVLGLMTAMSAVLGTLRLHTPELGEVIVTAPTDAASPDAQRSWAALGRPRVASHFALEEPWQRRGPR